MKSFMGQIRHFLILFFVAIFQFFFAPKVNAQCMGEFRIVATYDSNGRKCATDNANSRILVVSSEFFGVRQASITTYNPIANMWNTSDMSFTYSGYSNGWYIYRCDIFMSGTNWLYLNKDGETVRLKYSFMKGKYNEYTKYVEGSDVDRGPTY